MFTLVGGAIGLVGAVILGVLFLFGLPFIIMAVIAIVAFALIAAVLGLVAGLFKLAIFVVLPVLVLFWVAKAVFGLGRSRSSVR